MSGPFGSSQWIYSSGAAAVEGQSLRFNDDDSAYLNWTPAAAGNRKTWTWSGWVKRGNLTNYHSFFSGYSSSTALDYLFFNNNDTLFFRNYNGTTYDLATNAVFRDPSAWYHIVLSVDTTQATSSDRVKLYVNGELQSLGTATYPSQNYDFLVNSTVSHYIGQNGYNYFDGYMSEVNFVDGTALDPTSFAETDANGQWVPITAPSVTYGTNGYYLTFENGIGDDESGNSNDFTATNLATTDIMLDNPTNNFSTLGPMVRSVRSEGNLRSSKLDTNYNTAVSSIAVSSGKWYSECRVTLDSIYPVLGIADVSSNTIIDTSKYMGEDSLSYGYFSTTWYFNGSSAGSHGLSISSGDILGVALDLDSAQNTLKIYVNGVLGSTLNINDPVEGYVVGSMGSSLSGAIADWNFGQDSSFHGLETAQGNSDGNGFGDFYYAPPAGYLALCTQNLPDPAIADGSDYFNTVLYTGDGTSSRSITGVGFQPDFVWLKTRSAADNHILQDAVRGNDRQLFSNTTEAELNNSTTQLLSFDSDGFTIGSDSGVNGSGRTFASWNWKANGSGSSNTDGSITSTVSANTTAGFSVVSYTGNLTAGATIGHGLSSAPDMIIVKNRDAATNWRVYHSALGATQYASLNNTDAFASATSVWNDTEPTSSVFTVGASSTTNPSGSNLLAYCFHSVEGYSKFGSYTGNGSTDGPFVYTGFRPSFVLVKATGTASSWFMWDVQRNTYNAATTPLFANVSYAEEATLYPIDFLSNGFKLRASSGYGTNESAAYIYMAFAENPFKYSNAR